MTCLFRISSSITLKAMRSAGTYLLIPTMVALAASAFAQPADEAPVWHSEWRTAQRRARQANKPIFAVLVCRH